MLCRYGEGTEEFNAAHTACMASCVHWCVGVRAFSDCCILPSCARGGGGWWLPAGSGTPCYWQGRRTLKAPFNALGTIIGRAWAGGSVMLFL